jgi:energy-coupling factor transporter ATP-binding protein EcfA2
MRKKSAYVVVLGPDGSGKSTVADLLASDLRNELKVSRRDFSFGILPSISSILNRKNVKAQPEEGAAMSGMVTPLTPFKSILVGIWYGLDHVLGHLSFVLAGKGRARFYVFARSYHDFLYQRAYRRIPYFIPRLFLALGPRPDLIVCPFRDPDVIHANKPELTAEEIREQYDLIVRHFESQSGFHLIDASVGAADTVGKITSLLGR